jgi:pSer/pThr/pTyr-binding forkhead associated (FHA) protein
MEMIGLTLLALRIGLALILYGFLVWAFSTLWRDLSRRSQALAVRKIPEIRLDLAASPGDGEHRFERPQVTLGRNPACELVIDDDTVSGQHARLVYRNNQWWIDDLNSTNGTFLNGQRVSTLIVLTSGDSLRLGQIDLAVTIEAGDGDLA